MAEIENVYRTQYHGFKSGLEFQYMGVCRNGRKFDIGDNVFFSPSKYQGDLYRGRIVGIEQTADMNPEYMYKITIPKSFFDTEQTINGDGKNYSNINCESIFFSIEEAKEYAMKECEWKHKREVEGINSFFKQFEKQLKSKE